MRGQKKLELPHLDGIDQWGVALISTPPPQTLLSLRADPPPRSVTHARFIESHQSLTFESPNKREFN